MKEGITDCWECRKCMKDHRAHGDPETVLCFAGSDFVIGNRHHSPCEVGTRRGNR